MQIPQALSLSHLEITIDEQIIYSGSKIPVKNELTFDTRAVEDGVRLLTVKTTDSWGKTTCKTIPLHVENWWNFHAELWQPAMDGWFNVDYNEIYDSSPGWVFDVDDADAFHGDPHRITRSQRSVRPTST